MKKIACLLLVFLCACSISGGLKISNRSGDIYNDYVEEPLPKMSKQYSKQLEISNLFIDKLIEKNYNYIYDNLLGNSIKTNTSRQQFKDVILGVVAQIGPIKEYKKMQWHFGKYQNQYIYSIKIIKHDKLVMNYIFLFTNEKIEGFYFRNKTRINNPNFM